MRAPPELDPGQVLLAVDAFGLTSNNITYAMFGEAMSYWDFFPAEDGWGRMPVWGFAEVAASRHDAVETGHACVWLLCRPRQSSWPPPARVGTRGFIDASAHRSPLPPAYNAYLRADADPVYDADTEDQQMLLRPLFFTSYLIDDFLDRQWPARRGHARAFERLEQDRERACVSSRPPARGSRSSG